MTEKDLFYTWLTLGVLTLLALYGNLILLDIVPDPFHKPYVQIGKEEKEK